MALAGYAALLAWAGAALVVYAGAATGIGRGLVRGGRRLQAVGLLLAGLLAQRAIYPKPRRSGGHGAAGVEASGGALKEEACFWLPVIAVCVLGLVVNACVDAARRRERMPPPPPLPMPARRYSERRRALCVIVQAVDAQNTSNDDFHQPSRE